MPLSHEAKLIDDVALAIRNTGSMLQSHLPQAGMALNNLAISVGQAGEIYERHRVDTIVKGTHTALIPIKNLLNLHRRRDESYNRYLKHDLALIPLQLINVEDERPLSEQHQRSNEERLFKRFVGTMFRRHYVKYGMVTDADAYHSIKALTGVPAVPKAYHIVDGNIVMTFEDEAGSFEHTLTFNKFYNRHDSIDYNVRSIWLDETLNIEFNSIGWQWLQAHVMASVCGAAGFGPDDYTGITNEQLLEAYLAIPEADTLVMFNKMTLNYPGDASEFLPPCRVDISYHYYMGNDKHALTVNVYPDKDLVALGADDSHPQNRYAPFLDSPTPIQKWIVENLPVCVAEAVAAVKAEREEDAARKNA